MYARRHFLTLASLFNPMDLPNDRTLNFALFLRKPSNTFLLTDSGRFKTHLVLLNFADLKLENCQISYFNMNRRIKSETDVQLTGKNINVLESNNADNEMCTCAPDQWAKSKFPKLFERTGRFNNHVVKTKFSEPFVAVH